MAFGCMPGIKISAVKGGNEKRPEDSGPPTADSGSTYIAFRENRRFLSALTFV
jgi:hypothetical protein